MSTPSLPYLDIADLGVRFTEQSNRSARSAAPYILRHITARINRNETFCLAEQMGLPAEALERRPGAVSGGQCQRACIGRALAAKPDILFLDEPLAALDTLTRQKVAELLVQVREQYRMTFFLVTHNLSFAARISSRVAVMYLGRIVEQAPAAQFF
ncbi:MAG: ATP-binding cassette domain-containing protein, partial [Candidatus Electrothrix sp. AW3_4]|nr:ATP-binding cassette domain-containing protein [Candidatus Electrothrix gigas]